MKSNTVLVLFLTGFVLGSIYDGFHTHSGTTYYPVPWLFQMAWWTPFLFGAASLLIGIAHIRFEAYSNPFLGSPTWGRVVLGFFAFGVLYFASGYFKVSTMLKFTTLGIGSLLIWYYFDRTRKGFSLNIAIATVGCLMEILLGFFNKFHYVHPDFLGIPFWLPFLYIGGSVTVGNLARKLEIRESILL